MIKQTIGARLMAGFGAVFLVMVLAGAFGVTSVYQAQQQYAELSGHLIPARAQVSALSMRMYQMSSSLEGYVLYEDDTYLRAYETALQQADLAVAEGRRLHLTGEDQADFDQLAELVRYYKITANSMTQMSGMGDRATAMLVLRRGVPILDEFTTKAERFQARADARAAAAQVSTRRQAEIAQAAAVGSLVVGLLVSLVLGFLLTRGITGPLGNLVTVARRVSEGDLTQAPTAPATRDEVAGLAGALGHMVDSLREVLATIRSAADEMVASGGLLSESAETTSGGVKAILERLGRVAAEWESQGGHMDKTRDDVDRLQTAIGQVASGAQEQAGRVVGAAQLMQQVTVTMAELSRAVEEVGDETETAYAAARTGGASVQAMSAGMERVEAAVERSTAALERLAGESGRIGEITGIIEGIAQQTSLLSLNAAIEAARAGESGRGFAVVAAEVRTLADRSNKAAREIAHLVQSIQTGTQTAVAASGEVRSEVAVGAEQARLTGSGLQAIIQAMAGVSARAQTIRSGVEVTAAHTAET